MIPVWLHALSIASLLLGALCAVVIAADLVRHPQHMGGNQRGRVTRLWGDQRPNGTRLGA